MNKLLTAAVLGVLTNSAFAQLSAVPPSSTVDGIAVQAKGINAGTTHWDSPTSLGAYRYTSSGPATPNMGAPDNILGLSWASSAPASFTASRSNFPGGTFRAIFVGASAGWLNDFGYTYTGNLAGPDSFTVFKNISAASPGNTVSFGDHVDIPLLPGENQTFDFWLNGVGGNGEANPPVPTDAGGVYSVIHPTNSAPYIAPGNVTWAQSPLMVSTWIPALSAYQDVATYLVGIEDWRLDRGSDNDRNDFLFAIQMFATTGGSSDQAPPFDLGPVPEPSTYGALGALFLVVAVGFRRIRKVNSAKMV